MAVLPLAVDPHAVEHRLVMVLIELCVIMFVARMFGVIFRRMGQPAVVGEILAGLALGPSVLGKIEMGIWHHNVVSGVLFSPEAAEVLTLLKELGLILLMFLIGLEFDFAHLRSKSRAAISISLVGVAVPFGLGCLLAAGIFGLVPRDVVNGVPREFSRLGFTLFLGTAMSITALPVLGRMMQEWNITRTRLGTITIAAAAINDAIGWILLAAVSAVARSEYTAQSTLIMVAMVAGFAGVMIVVVRPILAAWSRRAMAASGGEVGATGLAVLLILVCLAGIVTSWIGIFAIFGAFLLGAILSGDRAFAEAAGRQLNGFVMVFFLPVFFTYTGLRTNVDALGSGQLWATAAAVCGVAIVGKLAGCTVAARCSGINWRESAAVGVMMNTRGLMELVVINVGHDLGVIPSSVFCMLVIMAIVTTLMTTPLLAAVKNGTELEPFMKLPRP